MANDFRLLVPHLRFLSVQIEAIFRENDLSEAINNSIFNVKDNPGYFSCFGEICCVQFDFKAAERFVSLTTKLISHGVILYDEYAARVYALTGNLLFMMGKLQEGKRHFEGALAIKLKLLGSEHPSVAATYNKLAILLGDQGDLKQAKEYHKLALDIMLQTLGPQHPHVATSYNNLAAVVLDQGDLKQGKEYLKRALDIRLQKLGPQHPHVATSYHN